MLITKKTISYKPPALQTLSIVSGAELARLTGLLKTSSVPDSIKPELISLFQGLWQKNLSVLGQYLKVNSRLESMQRSFASMNSDRQKLISSHEARIRLLEANKQSTDSPPPETPGPDYTRVIKSSIAQVETGIKTGLQSVGEQLLSQDTFTLSRLRMLEEENIKLKDMLRAETLFQEATWEDKDNFKVIFEKLSTAIALNPDLGQRVAKFLNRNKVMSSLINSKDQALKEGLISLGAKEVSVENVVKDLMGLYFIGRDKLLKVLGDVEIPPAPPLPSGIIDMLNSTNSLNPGPGSTIGGSHILQLIPNTINSEPLNLKKLTQLSMKAHFSKPITFEAETQGAYLNESLPESRWFLIPRSLIRGTIIYNYSQQEACITSFPGYERATSLQTAFAGVVYYCLFGKHLFNMSVACKETYQDTYSLKVKIFAFNGYKDCYAIWDAPIPQKGGSVGYGSYAGAAIKPL